MTYEWPDKIWDCAFIYKNQAMRLLACAEDEEAARVTTYICGAVRLTSSYRRWA